MIAKGEDELICDLAETYHIMNYRELQPTVVATLAIGLSDDSRIKRKLAGQKLTFNQIINTLMLDDLNLNIWTKTKDAAKGRNKPKSLYKMLTEPKKEKEDLRTFDSIEDYEAWRRSMQGE